jgi:protein-tyrosine phosphatase
VTQAFDRLPLHIDHVLVPSGGLIGLTHCPGRRGIDDAGRFWQRQLSVDLAAIVAWRPCVVVTLLQPKEFVTYGVPTLPTAMRQLSVSWHHVPIPDMGVPDVASQRGWAAAGPDIAAALDGAERIVLHCASGLGRSGMIAAKLLANLGLGADDAIALVRRCRPGAIETVAQEAFVHASTGARL